MGQRDKLNPAIYCIQNTTNKKRYIGSATRLKERWRIHRSALKRNCHFSSHLQAAWNKYGADCFEWSVLEKIDPIDFTEEQLVKKLLEREEYWIQFYKTTDRKFGYNTRQDCTTNLGLKWSEESKKAFSEKKKKQGLSKEIIEGLKAAWKTDEFRENHRRMQKEWQDSLSEEEWQKIQTKKSESLKEHYKENLEKYGIKRDPNLVKKGIETAVKNGFYTTVYTYLLTNGKFFKKFTTIAEGLKFFGISGKNTASIKTRLDSDVYMGVIWSTEEYIIYPKEKLDLIKQNNNCREAIIVDSNNYAHYCKSKIELTKIYNIPEYFVYKHLKHVKSAEYEGNIIYNIAPAIGDCSSGVGEIIENLYKKDNNEASQSLNGSGSCND